MCNDITRPVAAGIVHVVPVLLAPICSHVLHIPVLRVRVKPIFILGHAMSLCSCPFKLQNKKCIRNRIQIEIEIQIWSWIGMQFEIQSSKHALFQILI